MKSFSEVMEVTRNVSAPAAFEDECCKFFYETLATLDVASTIVEVGCEFGRSSSIIAQIAQSEAHKLTFIDPFVDPTSAISWFGMIRKCDVPFTLYNMTTDEAVKRTTLPTVVDFVFIDGSHTVVDLTIDCQVLLHRVKRRGFACFHDYGRDSLKEVREVVDDHMTDDWELMGVRGTLGIWRKR